ncbi:MAG: hypothetical protein GU343_02165 [Nanoarchaeota archaeon]|jgi:hypothetical protein|nr:hypothetical protein [Nanoarchaeota archaeon]
MSEDKLADIIKSSFEEVIEYFNKNGIKVEGLRLTILESPELLIQKYGKDKVNENTGGWYDSGTIYIIKNSIKNVVDRVSSNLNEISNINIFTISRNGVLWPVPINDNDIKKVIVKADAESILIHEIGHAVLHSIGSNDEWKASFVEFLVYFYKNELYKYPEVYKIMERNVKRCEKFMQEKNPPSYLPYSLGYCFANDIIYAYENILNKGKQSPKLNIKDTIEKLKYFSEEDGIKITKMVNTLLQDYVNIKNMLNIKANMLSCLLEKLPNIMDNINE